jgi:orotidine-5'-phosphate decarboxylase
MLLPKASHIMADVSDTIIVALDLPSTAEAEAMVERLSGAATFFKIGMELVYEGGGLDLARRLAKAGYKVFIDLKLHDIPNTVERATARLGDSGATFLTVHAYPQSMRAALAGAKGSPLRLLGVSVLTSMEDGDLAQAGFGLGVADLVRRRARQASEIGLHGLVSSAAEIALVRETASQALTLVTPGIRPAGSETGDQKRVMTPAEAIRLGADHLVVGRPITGAVDPRAAFHAIVNDLT